MKGKAIDGREGSQTVQAYYFSHDGDDGNRYASLLEETYQKTR